MKPSILLTLAMLCCSCADDETGPSCLVTAGYYELFYRPGGPGCPELQSRFVYIDQDKLYNPEIACEDGCSCNSTFDENGCLLELYKDCGGVIIKCSTYWRDYGSSGDCLYRDNNTGYYCSYDNWYNYYGQDDPNP